MKKTLISVTDAARDFADCVRRVLSRGETFVLLKRGTLVARLIPGAEKVRGGVDLGPCTAKGVTFRG